MTCVSFEQAYITPDTNKPPRKRVVTIVEVMYCDNCGGKVEGHFNFCPGCGETVSSDVPGIAPSIRNNLTKEEAARFYFERGFQYNSILNFLSKFNAINISYWTLLNRLDEKGLRRRNQNIDEMEVRRLIKKEMDGAGNSVWYRKMWQTIRTKYHTNASRALVQSLVRDIDPEGSDARRRQDVEHILTKVR